MSNFMYHTVIPENNKSSFTEYDNIDFVMTFENRALNLNSVRIEGDLLVTQGSGTPLYDPSRDADKVCMDPLVGSHSFCESIQTSFFNGTNLIENLVEYPRYVKMRNACRKAEGDMNNGSNVCELLAPNQEMTTLLLQGVTPTENRNAGDTANITTPLSPDFSFKPQICLNNAQADGMAVLPYSKSGAVRLTINLARVNGALFGADVDGNTKYQISNLQVSFSSVPETPDLMGNKIVMNTVQAVKPSVESGFANIGVKVPAICNAVSISFQPQNEENTAYHNNLQLTKVPNLTELQYLFNDSTNSLVSYLLRDYEEIVNRGIESMFSTGKNSLSINKLNANNGFIAGLYFDDFIDLRNQKFNVQLTSGISGGTSSLVMYLYFHSIISL